MEAVEVKETEETQSEKKGLICPACGSEEVNEMYPFDDPGYGECRDCGVEWSI